MLALPPEPAVESVRMPGISSSTSASVRAPKSLMRSLSTSVTETELRIFDFGALVAVTTTRFMLVVSFLSSAVVVSGAVCCAWTTPLSMAAKADDAISAATWVRRRRCWRAVCWVGILSPDWRAGCGGERVG